LDSAHSHVPKRERLDFGDRRRDLPPTLKAHPIGILRSVGEHSVLL
jgi:hypothetical protein